MGVGVGFGGLPYAQASPIVEESCLRMLVFSWLTLDQDAELSIPPAEGVAQIKAVYYHT